MDVLIRDIDKDIVRSIDEKAAQSELSRNEYLKELIEQVIVNDLFKKERRE